MLFLLLFPMLPNRSPCCSDSPQCNFNRFHAIPTFLYAIQSSPHAMPPYYPILTAVFYTQNAIASPTNDPRPHSGFKIPSLHNTATFLNSLLHSNGSPFAFKNLTSNTSSSILSTFTVPANRQFR